MAKANLFPAPSKQELDLIMSDPQIFLSYAREDEARVRALYQRLTEAGFSVWMDTEKLLPGERWEYEIKKALKAAQLVIVCLSSVSVMKRGFLQKELREALDRLQEKLDGDIYLIPARLVDCPVPESLSNIHWVNLFEEDGWVRLLNAIRVGLGQTRNEQEQTPQAIEFTRRQDAPETTASSTPRAVEGRNVTTGSVNHGIIVIGDGNNVRINKGLRTARRKAR